ncbi:hypothetical protein LEM8419_02667 [Neolewinella maritima]|uniref:Xylose isomerase n=1 Tax=Neolewinella maritima TaxID=1383882 RepID=A0ABN8FAK0_9BACT|nr:metabolite traffic protein EboE [Neolewinella maritima]CAH1001761.1 hypothetical protein LEM8419_02667 [Neolewinella maritima]
MHTLPESHLTYCTNIHSGETWAKVCESLQYVLQVRDNLQQTGPFGIGLRLSAQAARELARTPVLRSFQEWLSENDCYVFTLNGFPYGDFHGQVVKDRVHTPDWTTSDRLVYTKQLFDILAELLPEGMTGGVSTSPLSYAPWHRSAAALRRTKEVSTHYLMELVDYLAAIHQRTGKLLHLDIEPEPDGVLGDGPGFIAYYQDYLLGQGKSETLVRRHLRMCYDVCHFAVNYESPTEVLTQLSARGIAVGKLQISAALKADLRTTDRQSVRAALQPYDEPTYLHQVNLRDGGNRIHSFPDLAPALAAVDNEQYQELRTHFHVPIYTDSYGLLQSTNDAIVETLRLWRADPFTHHLEVETYTWDVLPDHQRLTLTDSIHRELAWVLKNLR